MLQLRPWGQRAVWGLIALELSALPMTATFLYLPWITQVERPVSTAFKLAWLWPVGFVLCKDIFRTHLSSDEAGAALRCLLAITWVKFAVLILLADGLCRWRVSNWLVVRRRAALVACLCPSAFALLIEISGNYYTVSDSPPRFIVLSLAVVNILVLLGIARLPWPRIGRAACSLPMWLAWIWWWRDLRFHLYFDITDAYVTLRVPVPLFGFVLYALALETTPAGASAASPSMARGSTS